MENGLGGYTLDVLAGGLFYGGVVVFGLQRGVFGELGRLVPLLRWRGSSVLLFLLEQPLDSFVSIEFGCFGGGYRYG